MNLGDKPHKKSWRIWQDNQVFIHSDHAVIVFFNWYTLRLLHSWAEEEGEGKATKRQISLRYTYEPMHASAEILYHFIYIYMVTLSCTRRFTSRRGRGGASAWRRNSLRRRKRPETSRAWTDQKPQLAIHMKLTPLLQQRLSWHVCHQTPVGESES